MIERHERSFFDQVYSHAFSILQRVAYRIVGDADVAEEISHDAFVRLYERIDKFPDVDQATYWLLRVGKNLALNYAKRKGREERAYERAYHEPQRTPDHADRPVLRDETAAIVQEALETLPDTLKEVIVLKEYGGLNYQEISAVLGITVANVKVRVHRARTRLLETLEDRDVYLQ